MSQYDSNAIKNTSGRTPVVLLDGKWGTNPSGDLSTVVKQILYSCKIYYLFKLIKQQKPA